MEMDDEDDETTPTNEGPDETTLTNNGNKERNIEEVASINNRDEVTPTEVISPIVSDKDCTNETTPTETGNNMEEELTFTKGDPSMIVGVARSGVSSILQVDEFSDLQHGSIDLRPSLNIGKTLDPVLSEQSPLPLYEHTNSLSVVLSMEQFINNIANTIGYEVYDLQLARKVYSLIETSGKEGLTGEKIVTMMANSETRNMAIVDIIQDLLNFGIVWHLLIITLTILSVSLSPPVSLSHCLPSVSLSPFLSPYLPSSIYLLLSPSLSSSLPFPLFSRFIQLVPLYLLLLPIVTVTCGSYPIQRVIG